MHGSKSCNPSIALLLFRDCKNFVLKTNAAIIMNGLRFLFFKTRPWKSDSGLKFTHNLKKYRNDYFKRENTGKARFFENLMT